MPDPPESEGLKRADQFLDKPARDLLASIGGNNETWQRYATGAVALGQRDAAKEQAAAARAQARAAERQAQTARHMLYISLVSLIVLPFSILQAREASTQRVAAEEALVKVLALAEKVAAIAYLDSTSGYVEQGNETVIRELADEVLQLTRPLASERKRFFDELREGAPK